MVGSFLLLPSCISSSTTPENTIFRFITYADKHLVTYILYFIIEVLLIIGSANQFNTANIIGHTPSQTKLSSTFDTNCNCLITYCAAYGVSSCEYLLSGDSSSYNCTFVFWKTNAALWSRSICKDFKTTKNLFTKSSNKLWWSTVQMTFSKAEINRMVACTDTQTYGNCLSVWVKNLNCIVL